jgi:hypothetical protein
MKRNYLFPAVIVCVVGLLLRLAWVLYLDPQAEGDAEAYRSLARWLADEGRYGETPTAWRPPGYSLVVSLTYMAGMSTEWGSRLVDIGASFLLPIVLAAIVWLRAGPRLGFWALTLFMLHPVTIGHAAMSLSQGVAAVCLYLALLACYAAAQTTRPVGRFALTALGGMALGYASLTRAECLVAIPIVAAYLGYRWRWQGWLGILVFLVASAGAIAPWTIRNYRVTERFVLISTNGGEVFFSANYVTDPDDGGEVNSENYKYLRDLEPDDVARNSLGFRLALEHMAKNPGIIARSMPGRWETYIDGFRHLAGSGSMEPGRELPRAVKQIAKYLVRYVYYLSLLPILIFCRRIWRGMRTDAGVNLVLGLYAVYFALLPLFEIKNINHYPFVWLLFLALFFSWNTGRQISGEDEVAPV